MCRYPCTHSQFTARRQQVIEDVRWRWVIWVICLLFINLNVVNANEVSQRGVLLKRGCCIGVVRDGDCAFDGRIREVHAQKLLTVERRSIFNLLGVKTTRLNSVDLDHSDCGG